MDGLREEIRRALNVLKKHLVYLFESALYSEVEQEVRLLKGNVYFSFKDAINRILTSPLSSQMTPPAFGSDFLEQGEVCVRYATFEGFGAVIQISEPIGAKYYSAWSVNGAHCYLCHYYLPEGGPAFDICSIFRGENVMEVAIIDYPDPYYMDDKSITGIKKSLADNKSLSLDQIGYIKDSDMELSRLLKML